MCGVKVIFNKCMKFTVKLSYTILLIGSNWCQIVEVFLSFTCPVVSVESQ